MWWLVLRRPAVFLPGRAAFAVERVDQPGRVADQHHAVADQWQPRAIRADIRLCGDGFPGYCWLFPCGGPVRRRPAGPPTSSK